MSNRPYLENIDQYDGGLVEGRIVIKAPMIFRMAPLISDDFG